MRLSCKSAFVLSCILALPACQRGGDRVKGLSLSELQQRYGQSVNAYELHTEGMGLGRAEVTPALPVTVREALDKVVITYHAPRGGIAPGGMVSVTYPPGCTLPQIEFSDSAGYVHMEADGDIPVAGEVILVGLHRKAEGDPGWNSPYHLHPRNRRVVVAGLPEGLPQGRTLSFTWSEVVVDRFARRFHGDRLLFRIQVDHDADGFAEEIKASPTIPKVADIPQRIMLRCRSTAVIGEPVKMNVLVLDQYDNPAPTYRGRIRFRCTQPHVQLPGPYDFTEGDNASHECYGRFDRPGYYWIEAIDTGNGFHARSNPIQVFEAEPEKKLYWGDLHVHTDMSSDARSDAHTTSTYEGSYLIGRYRYSIDFQVNTDHHSLAGMDYGAVHWEAMKEITNRANDPDHFVTLLANELSHGKGDQNVYFPGDEAPFLLASGEHHPQAVWDSLGRFECFTVPHHVAQSMRPWQWENFNPALMTVVEIFSNHGRAEFHGNAPHYSPHPVATLDGHTWVDQLNTGKKLGAIASSDDHWARPGTIGLTGVWASRLNREEIYRQIKNRHCYASTAARVILHFTVNGEEMGSFVHTQGAPEIAVTAASPDTIEKAEVIRNGEVATLIEPGSLLAEWQWTDEEFSDSAYYYIRLTLRPDANAEEYMKSRQQFIWSSPVWVTSH
jgi:hypothetical protein